MSDTHFQFATRTYAQLMGEIKIRLLEIETKQILLQPPHHLKEGAFVDAENCFLQIRLICEGIALGAILIRDHDRVNQKLEKSYRADHIFQLLKQQNELCFPLACTMNRTDDGTVQMQVNDKSELNVKWLEKMYNEADNLLHRGRFKYLKNGKVRHFDLSKINRWTSQLRALLAVHIVLDRETSLAIVCRLNPKDEPVSVVIASGTKAEELLK